ncbi:hypothetical protein EDB81DRAFT_701293 [Dactylonectria macrodidyma]|uniref:Zn(2)-C6 fungal-type domain-containing protein n=1 Tax=Dactylonectria macrodidyma TaxID=307937 RepID=A0A9P9DGJ3_9HYPO|nr:hypothetical protein EDB81DRAFT_701293 [Dactylonectria macrodidyma]
MGRQRSQHQKTRTGCVTCKRRKIKCDESQPICANCVRFRAPCGYNKPGEPLMLLNHGAVDTTTSRTSSGLLHRKPGRPRKVWTTEDVAAASADSLQQWLRPGISNETEQRLCQLSIDSIELLLHFTKHTADTLANHSERDADDLRDFWKHNVPRIGLQNNFILHLVFALAARHLLFLDSEARDSDRRRHLVSRAEQHMAIGVMDLARELSNLNEDNCGALYVGSVLVCICTFAAGPTGPCDLLLCSTSDLQPHAGIPLIHGVRLIRESFPPEILFAGLAKPMNRQESVMTQNWRPRWMELQLPRLDWEEALDGLRTLVISHDADSTSCMRAFDTLEIIYKTTYGTRDADASDEQNPKGRFILAWLYVLDDAFIASLQQRDPVSLLILAHFSPLLRNHQDDWFLIGWTEQLILGVRAVLPTQYIEWMQWPLEAAGLLCSSPEADDG